ncbi:MAG TPA: calcium-binding protein [Anaerolineaceae bacterium]|nr:calcium-binding protein [Anaerolineaceae bacterium]HPN50406.1 calcium-binding protein [Anaerolineaceae bacterium]
MDLVNRSAAVIKPKQPFVDWINQNQAIQSLSSITLETAQNDSTAVLIPDLPSLKDLTEFIQQVKPNLFEMELASWCANRSTWPADRSAEQFDQWFHVDIHSMVWDITDESAFRVIQPEAEEGFKVSDAVAVKLGVKDDEQGIDLAGWQGRIMEIIQAENGQAAAIVRWDSLTLRRMSRRYMDHCRQNGQDWGEMVLNLDQLELTQPRDTQEQAEKAYRELSARSSRTYPEDQMMRIQQVMDDGEENELSALETWRHHLKTSLTLPFEAQVVEFEEGKFIHSGDKVLVTCVALVDDMYGVTAHIKFKGRYFEFPICYLEAMEDKTSNRQLVEDYNAWFATR